MRLYKVLATLVVVCAFEVSVWSFEIVTSVGHLPPSRAVSGPIADETPPSPEKSAPPTIRIRSRTLN
jgi:hypothetical protein